MSAEPIRLGVVGLGRAFVLMWPTFAKDDRVRLVAACAPRQASRDAFVAEFGGRAYRDVEALCADPDVEAVYVATPHQLHRAHVEAAAAAGKHVLVDKPLCVSLEDGKAMVAACEAAGVRLVVGPSHSFDAPVALAHRLRRDGAIGRVRMIQALNYTDFLYRPRRPEELRTGEGGGVLFSQGVHQVDIVRLLAGGLGREVSALTGNWDAERPAEGAYSALMTFEGGCFATLTYSGYAHFDSDVWMDGVSELGRAKAPGAYGDARRALREVRSPEAESALKSTRTYGAARPPDAAPHHEHFGPVIVVGERGDLRLTPAGVHVYGDLEHRFHAVPPPRVPRAEVVDVLVEALRGGRDPVQTGAWGLASLEVCHAILRAAETGRSVRLTRQVPDGADQDGAAPCDTMRKVSA